MTERNNIHHLDWGVVCTEIPALTSGRDLSFRFLHYARNDDLSY
jgi:hypothetical protein